MSEQESAYSKAVTDGLRNMKGVSTGECPGCESCAEFHDMTAEEHAKAWHDGLDETEECFSWSPCGICGSSLGGGRHVWHWVDVRNPTSNQEIRTIIHEHDACTDCVMYLANGDEPEEWRSRP